MPPIESSNPTTAGPEYSNIAEAQEKDLKTNFKKIIEVQKKLINPLKKSRKRNQEKKQCKKMNKTVHDLKTENQ